MAESPELRAGFVGLGEIGGPMARNIIDAGYPTTLWARREATLQPFVGTGYRRAADLVDLGRSSDVIGVCVFDDADVREVTLGKFGLLSGMAPSSVIVMHSTISPAVVIELARSAAEKGVAVLDAPVSGGRLRAIEGTLTMMVGGNHAAFEKALPVLRACGRSIQHLGPLGSGQKMKVLNNVLGFANLRMAALAIETGRELGLDDHAMIASLQSASGASFALDGLVNHLLTSPETARHAVRFIEKDARIFKDICAAAGIMRSTLDQLAEESVDFVRVLGQREDQPS